MHHKASLQGSRKEQKIRKITGWQMFNHVQNGKSTGKLGGKKLGEKKKFRFHLDARLGMASEFSLGSLERWLDIQ